MTKTHEIEALQKFRASLPHDSYLAQWLEHAEPEIIADIRNDIFPTTTPAQARAEAVATHQRATERAADLISKAEQDAAQIVKAAEERANYIRSHIRRLSSDAATALRTLSEL